MKSRKILVLRYLFWALSVVIMTFIFLSSSQNAQQSSNTSGSFIKSLLTAFFDGFEEMSEEAKAALVSSLQHFVRKAAHFSVYMLLGMSLSSALFTYDIKTIYKIGLSASLSLIYAVSDEVHQLFVPGRGGMVTDVLLDFSGSVIGIAFVSATVYIYRRLVSRRL